MQCLAPHHQLTPLLPRPPPRSHFPQTPLILLQNILILDASLIVRLARAREGAHDARGIARHFGVGWDVLYHTLESRQTDEK